MKKIKLTESQARTAIRKWLFEYNTDSGVSQRPSTDDKVAGTLGDDRTASTIPKAFPIIPMDQMANQLSVEAPPVEDPEWKPANDEELARAAHQLSKGVPSEEIEWYYSELVRSREQALERANQTDTENILSGDEDIKNPIRVQKASKESANESKQTKRWMKTLLSGLKEARWSNARQKDAARKWKQGDPLKLHRGKDDDIGSTYDGHKKLPKHQPNPNATAEEKEMEKWEEMLAQSEFADEMDDMSAEDKEYMARDFVESNAPDWMTDEDIQDEINSMLGIKKPRQKPKDYDPEEIDADFSEEAKLKELVSSGVFPKISTLNGMQKMIARKIDPVVQMWFNATLFSELIVKFIRGQAPYAKAAKSGKDYSKLNGPTIFFEAMLNAKLLTVDNVAELRDNKAALLDSGMYHAVMSKAVMQPIMSKWKKEVGAGRIDVTNHIKKQISWEEGPTWIQEMVVDRWNSLSKGRKGNDATKAMTDRLEFLEAIKSDILDSPEVQEAKEDPEIQKMVEEESETK